MEARKDELKRQAQRELDVLEEQAVDGTLNAGLAALDEADAYIPTEEEQRALSVLTATVAERMGVDPQRLGSPSGVVSCIRDSSHSLHRFEGAVGACISVHDNTAAVQFVLSPEQIVSPEAMDVGVALVYPGAVQQRAPATDWRVTLSYSA